MRVCVCVCARVCAHACVHACVYMTVCVCGRNRQLHEARCWNAELHKPPALGLEFSMTANNSPLRGGRHRKDISEVPATATARCLLHRIFTAPSLVQNVTPADPTKVAGMSGS
jgi:hypothetical protein